MSPQEKQVVEVTLKYFEMLNSNIEDLFRRVSLVEWAIKASPELLEKYRQAETDMRMRPSPGLPVQLAAIRQTIEQLR